MFSPHDPDAVLAEVGDKFLLALVRATAAAGDDLTLMRAWQPRWCAGMFQREIAGLVHSRIWWYLTHDLRGMDGVQLHTKEPHREVRLVGPLGRTVAVRIKRHSDQDRISSYPTASDIEFWGGSRHTVGGMEEITLAAGYRWDREQEQVGPAVISYREGRDNLVWAVEVEAPDGPTGPLRYVSVAPRQWEVDLPTRTAVEEAERDERHR